jgi:cytochrome b561
MVFEPGCLFCESALAASIIRALIIIEDEGVAYAVHTILGVIALVLVALRLVRGFADGERRIRCSRDLRLVVAVFLFIHVAGVLID